eukprot:472441-Rhodomonas_salina.1
MQTPCVWCADAQRTPTQPARVVDATVPAGTDAAAHGAQWSGVLSHWENHSTRSGFHASVAAKCFSLETLAHLLP